MRCLLWKGVRRELMTFDGAIPLIQRDLTSVWSPQVLAVDASEFGLGATQARFPVEEVRRLGQVNERWRFKDPNGRNPRQRILQEQYESVSLGEGLMVVEGENQTDIVQDSGFCNVPFSSVNRDWTTVGMHRWRKKSSLPVYEGRASLFAVKHILRSKRNFGKRHVILSDSLTATCAISRGRSPRFNLRRVCSQIGALALATGSYFCIRWIPSEWNPADNPSRGKWSPSEPVQFFGDGFVSATSIGDPSKVDISQTTFKEGRKFPGVEGNNSSATETTDILMPQLEMQIDRSKVSRSVKKMNRQKLRAGVVVQQKGRTVLEEASVSKECLTRYTQHWDLIKPKIHDRRGKLKSMKMVDNALAKHLADMYRDGEDISSARYAIASAQHFVPSLRSKQNVNLPRVKQSLKGWNKLSPPRSRLPVPWEVACMLAMESFRLGVHHFGLHILLMFCLYLRPTECLRLRACDLVPPNGRAKGQYQWWSVVLHPQEEGIPSKTMEFDEALSLDLDYHQSLGLALQRYLDKMGTALERRFSHIPTRTSTSF